MEILAIVYGYPTILQISNPLIFLTCGTKFLTYGTDFIGTPSYVEKIFDGRARSNQVEFV